MSTMIVTVMGQDRQELISLIWKHVAVHPEPTDSDMWLTCTGFFGAHRTWEIHAKYMEDMDRPWKTTRIIRIIVRSISIPNSACWDLLRFVEICRIPLRSRWKATPLSLWNLQRRARWNLWDQRGPRSTSRQKKKYEKKENRFMYIYVTFFFLLFLFSSFFFFFLEKDCSCHSCLLVLSQRLDLYELINLEKGVPWYGQWPCIPYCTTPGLSDLLAAFASRPCHRSSHVTIKAFTSMLKASTWEAAG